VKQVCTNSLKLKNDICYLISLLVPGVVQVLGTDQSTVTWGPPMKLNGIITNYQVITFEYDNDDNVTRSPLLEANQHYIIPNLGKQPCIDDIRC